MRVVNIAALKANLGEYVRIAKDGETVQIYEHRRAVAELSGLTVPKAERVAQGIIREGLAQWQGGKPMVSPIKPRKGPAALADAVIEDRG